MAGLPVLASKWKYNKEFIKEGKNGFIHKVKDSSSLADDIVKLVNNKQLALDMRKTNIEESKKYNEENVFPILQELI